MRSRFRRPSDRPKIYFAGPEVFDLENVDNYRAQAERWARNLGFGAVHPGKNVPTTSKAIFNRCVDEIESVDACIFDLNPISGRGPYPDPGTIMELGYACRHKQVVAPQPFLILGYAERGFHPKDVPGSRRVRNPRNPSKIIWVDSHGWLIDPCNYNVMIDQALDKMFYGKKTKSLQAIGLFLRENFWPEKTRKRGNNLEKRVG